MSDEVVSPIYPPPSRPKKSKAKKRPKKRK